MTLQDALDFDAADSTRTCEDYDYADRRLKYFEGVVENMTGTIPQEDLDSQISLLQEIKLMMQQLEVTIPQYSGILPKFNENWLKFCFFIDVLSLIQVKPSLLGNSFSTLQIASNYDIVSQEKFLSFQTKLDSFFSETYGISIKIIIKYKFFIL